MPYMGNQQYHI